ncbi:phosphatase PAP2 family protein [Virgibacillus ihumii]|uniref:phosphatase PAP2 family protein n=1 Tax=Virgibacillus ihumii TaxID=2686091 RepID=UPI00157CC058|nr:phosphatase PAP2 family protein [Virgibacillus ihumii]
MTVHQKRIALLTWVLISALLFVMIAVNFKETMLLNFGEWVQSYLYNFLGSFGDFVFVVITYIGSAYVSFPIMGILICVFLFQKRYWTMLLLVFNLIGVRQLNWLLKTIFERPRPELEHLVQVSSESFPSGHSMNSIAFFGFLAYLLYLKLKASGKPFRWVWTSAVVLIAFISLSRVYLGVHYPLDVIGGILAGGAWLLLSIFLYTYVPKKEHFNRRERGGQKS